MGARVISLSAWLLLNQDRGYPVHQCGAIFRSSSVPQDSKTLLNTYTYIYIHMYYIVLFLLSVHVLSGLADLALRLT